MNKLPNDWKIKNRLSKENREKAFKSYNKKVKVIIF